MRQSYTGSAPHVKRGVWAMVLAVLVAWTVGCGGDPWGRAGLAAPEGLESREWYGIYLRDAQIGVEERLVGAREVVRRRHYRFVARGRAVDLRAGNREPPGQAHDPGPLEYRPQTGPDQPGNVDLGALLRVEHAPVAGARRSHHARYEVKGPVPGAAGGELVLDHPLPAELAERDRIRAALNQTRARLTVHPTPGAPNALVALQSGRGDCNEHAVVFVHLAEAAGLQARTAAGVVYDDSTLGAGFYPHAWAEVHTDSHGWVPVDPVMGQVVADATHVPLGEGAFDARILSRLEHVALEVVEIR